MEVMLEWSNASPKGLIFSSFVLHVTSDEGLIVSSTEPHVVSPERL